MPESGSQVTNPSNNGPSRTTRMGLFRNAIYSSGSWVLNVLVLMVATPIIVSKLTSEGYGIYALLTGLVGYYGLLDFGLGQGVTKYVAQYKASDNLDGINRSINAALWVQAIAGFSGSVLLVVFAGPILGLFDISPALLYASRIGLYVSAVGFFFTMLSGTFSSALMGLQLYALISKVNVVMNVTLTCLILVALQMGGGLLSTIGLTALSSLIMFVVYFFMLKSQLSGYRFSIVLDRKYLKTIASYSSYLFISKVSNTFGLYVVRFVVGYYLGPTGVTYYVIPAKLVGAVGGFLSSAFGVLFPFSSSLGVTDDLSRIRRALVESSKYFASFSIPAFLFLGLFSRLILTLWMGKEFAEHTWVILSLLAFGSLLGSLTTVPNLITMGLGYSRIVGIFSIVSALFYVVFLPLLTSWFGLEGTGWAMVASTLPGLFLVRYELRNIFHFDLLPYWNAALGVHLFPVALVVLSYRWWNSSTAALSFLPEGGLLIVFCIYVGILVARGYIPIGQWGKDLLKLR